ncbi:MAG: neutral/alkaline non-lysosomal ceramidase N-terminal domain-containing protein [Caldilineaceae bacterium]|nr:neutral/alkaline non-lysosomal ceramidase N-terminal domain-containing protein [Caldilineaceae bacterium]
MTTLRAGFGRVDITPKLGCKLVGYGGREQGATAVHDALLARALVLENEDGCWGLVSADLCYLSEPSVTAIRQAVSAQTGIPGEHLLISTTHTHAGPHDRHADNWDRPLAQIIADAVVAAYAALQPAKVGSGAGFLYGYSINRRWLDRPVDPGVTVLRVDDAQGNILGLWCNFACHSVVLGYDNLQLSGDWPGYAMRNLEEQLGNGATCLFTQGGSGNINPLVAGVRQQLRAHKTVRAIGNVSAYYGAADDPIQWNIGDRKGGTFAEVAELGDAFAEEAGYIAQRIVTTDDAPIWSHQVTVNAAADPDEHPVKPPAPLLTEQPLVSDASNIPCEIMLLQIGDLMLVTEPGEVFTETAIDLKVKLRAMGYRVPALVTYTNGFLLYLPEPADFPEGGYEVNWAVSLGLSKKVQPRMRAAVLPILAEHGQE